LCSVLGVSGCARTALSRQPAALYQDAEQKFQHGDLAGAFNESDAAYKRFSGRNEDWALRFRMLDAEVLVWRGLNRDALQLLDPELPAAFSTGDTAVRREILRGLAHSALQESDDADRYVDVAERLAQSNRSDLMGEVILSRGNLAVARGDLPSAETAYRQSLQFAREKNQTFLVLKALGSLGYVAMTQQRYDESIDWDTQALELSRKLGARIATGKVTGNMARSYYKMGDFERALSLLSEAKAVAVELHADKDIMTWRMNIGSIDYDQHSYSAAAQNFQQALDIAKRLENKAVTAVCLSNLAVVDLTEKRYDDAEQHNREAVALERATDDRLPALYSLFTEAHIATGRKDFLRAESDFLTVIREDGGDRSLLWYAQAGLAEVFVAENRVPDGEAYFRKAMETIESARSSLRRADFRLSFLSDSIVLYDAYADFLVSQRRTAEALEVAEVSRARTLAEGLGINSSSSAFPIKGFNPRQIAKRSNATILSYWLGVEHSYVWVITPERVTLFTLPPAAEIDPLVQSYRQALLGSRDVLETQNAAGRKLYDLLVAPAAKMIPKGARVTILPDGSLYGLNFETLLAPAPQLHYWIEDVDVSYANSLTLLATGAARHASHAKKLLLVGDPVSPDAEFPKLPQAATEMTGIENYFPAAERTVFSGAEATPDSYLKSQPADFSYIHFVAHGTASRTSPLDSAVILSKQGDDYKLYARDIIQHPLHADLVTISACHGEGVRTYSGEGLVGLSWAFLRAGAHGVIAALWEVNDNSTPQLMDHLYSEIGKGVPPDAALRDAKLALLHSGDVYRRPFYWALFELYRGS
jgi:CHAT domain-containing protein